jgi:hypothetical protein
MSVPNVHQADLVNSCKQKKMNSMEVVLSANLTLLHPQLDVVVVKTVNHVPGQTSNTALLNVCPVNRVKSTQIIVSRVIVTSAGALIQKKLVIVVCILLLQEEIGVIHAHRGVNVVAVQR